MTATTSIDPRRVEEILLACLYKEGEDQTGHIVAEGLVRTVGLHPGRIEEFRQEIHNMLAELPNGFKAKSGGGMSFMDASHDRHGRQWADLHLNMEQLFQLGIAIGEVAYVLPREEWVALPYGMPFIVINQ